MSELIEKIKSSEGSPKILKNLYSEEEIRAASEYNIEVR